MLTGRKNGVDGARVVVSVSGGKDSTATCLHLKELGIPFEAVFMDTGWELPETYAYLRDVLPSVIGPIRRLRSEVELDAEREAMAQELEAMLGHYSAMVRWCLKNRMMPARQVRWCTQATKVEPMLKWLETLEDEVVSVVGIRAEESATRREMPEWEWSDKMDMWTWRPLIAWTLDDVIAIHHRHGIAPNPAYLAGASRVGCAPCIFARKAEIKWWATKYPVQVAVVRRLEEMIAKLYAATKAGRTVRAARPARPAGYYCAVCDAAWLNEWTDEAHDCDGEREWYDDRPAEPARAYQPPTWFQHNSERTPDMAEIGYAWPIDRVIEWAGTARGGKQFELFAAPVRDAGCMRWGLCDTGGRDEEK